MSPTPPGGKPTMMRTDRVGYACARAVCDNASSAAAPATRCRNFLRWPSNCPASSLTDPDVQFSRVRFFMGEPRSWWVEERGVPCGENRWRESFAPLYDPGRTDDPSPLDGFVDAAPALPTAKASAVDEFRGSITRLWHLLPTLQERCCHHPCKARFRLAGSPLPGGS